MKQSVPLELAAGATCDQRAISHKLHWVKPMPAAPLWTELTQWLNQKPYLGTGGDGS